MDTLPACWLYNRWHHESYENDKGPYCYGPYLHYLYLQSSHLLEHYMAGTVSEGLCHDLSQPGIINTVKQYHLWGFRFCTRLSPSININHLDYILRQMNDNKVVDV